MPPLPPESSWLDRVINRWVLSFLEQSGGGLFLLLRQAGGHQPQLPATRSVPATASDPAHLCLRSSSSVSLPSTKPTKQPRQKKKRMAMRLMLSVVLLAVVASRLPSTTEAANYTVGDEKGWNPDVDYTAWVKKHKPFYKGDWLVFEYQNGRSDVVQVDEVGYDNCDKANALSSYSKGHSYAFQLKEAKDYYFICSYGYCYSGMKLHVTAKSTSSSSSGGGKSSSSSSSSSDDSSDDDSSDEKPSKSAKSKAKSNAASPSVLAGATTPFAAVAALLLNRMLF